MSSLGRRLLPILLLAILFLAFLLVVPPGFAAGVGEHLGAPRFDTVSETTHRKIAWQDFKGGGQAPPGWNRWRRGSYAHVGLMVRLGAYEIEVAPDGDGFRAAPVGIRPYAVMDKFHSAVKPGSRKDDVLAHEQLHFDLAEAIARRLAVELSALTGGGEDAAAARLDLEQQIRREFAAGLERVNEVQSSYDGETQNGGDKKRQRRWSERIQKMLAESTAELEVLLAGS